MADTTSKTFTENVNHVAELDNSLGYELVLRRSNIVLNENVTYSATTEIRLFNRTTNSTETLSVPSASVTATGLNAYLGQVKTALELAYPSCVMTHSITQTVSALGTFNNAQLSVVLSGNDYYLRSINIKISEVDGIQYDIDGQLTSPLEITPSFISLNAGMLADINTVAANTTNINALVANEANIDAVAESLANVNTIASIQNLANMTTVANDLNAMDLNGIADVTVVANNLVLGAASSINIVSADKANIDAVAANQSNIDAVAANEQNINAAIGSAAATAADVLLTHADVLLTHADVSSSLVNANNSAASALTSSESATASEASKVMSATKAAEALSSATTSAIKASESAASAVSSAASAATASAKSIEADVSAASASSSEINAAGSASDALSSANTAASQAATATTKASEANTSALASASSATTASTQAGIATTKAGEALASANASEASRVAAAGILDSFDDRYLGAKSSEPLLDNDGDALLDGALYFDSTTKKMRVWDSLSWGDALTLTASSIGSLTNKTIDNITNTVGADHVHYKVRNASGSTIVIGTILAASGSQPGTDYIQVIPLTDPQAQIAIGIAHTTLENNGIGLALNTGVKDDTDTSAWTVGTILYAGASVLTNIKPTSGRYQACAYVLRQHATQGTLLCEFTEPQMIASTTQAGYVLLNNTLTSTSSTQALTAAQGKVLQDGKEPAFVKNTGFNKNFGTTAGTVLEGNHYASTGSSHGIASTSVNGFMSSADKTKLDGIASSAEVNQNAFSNIAVSGQTTVAADSKTDTLTFVAGTNVSITTDAVNDTITISANDTSVDWTEIQNKPDPTITLAGDATGSVTLTNVGSGTLTVTVVDDSHNHVISNVDGLQTALDGKQPIDATLTALAGVTTSADKYIYATAVDTFTTGTITSFGRSLVDDINAATARGTIGISATNTPFTPAGNIAATDVQTALQELDSEKANSVDLIGAIGNISSPLLDMPLKNSLAMKAGVGSATFTRASTATYIDRYGVLKRAAIDEPRFEKEGYLNEGGSTNLMLNSEFDASWGTSGCVITYNNALCPDGVNTKAALLTANGGTTAYTAKSATFTSGTTYTQSFFYKAGTYLGNIKVTFGGAYFGNTIHAVFTKDGDFVSITDANVIKAYGSQKLANGWIRIWAQAVCTASGSGVIGTYLWSAVNLNAGETFYAYGAQLEALPFATSYIPTVASTVTSGTNFLNVTREGNLPNLEVNGEITIAYDIVSLGNTGFNQWIWGLYSSAVNSIGAYITASGYISSICSSASGTKSVTGILLNKNQKYRVVQVINNTGNSIYINGILAGFRQNADNRLTDTQNSAYTQLRIGSHTPTISTQANQFFGNISNFRIWDKALSSAEVALA